MDPVQYYLTKFDFTISLLNNISCDSPDSTENLSDLSELSELTDLSDLSPLTSAAPSPLSTTHPLPADNSPSGWPQTICRDELHSCEDAIMRTPEPQIRLEKGEGGSRVPGNPPLKSRQEKMKARRHMRSRKLRKKARARKHEAMDAHHIAREGPRKKYVDPAVHIHCAMDTEGSKVTSSGYTARDGGSKSKKAWSLSEMTGNGSKWNFRLIKWDGSTTQTILDSSRRIIGILAGHPQTEDWPSVHVQAAEAIEAQRSQLHLPPKMRKHRRGAFPAVAGGISFGGGQRRPTNLNNNPENASAFDWLSSLQPLRRIAGFASSIMATWAPMLHGYYAQTLNALCTNDPSLRRLFPSSIFCAASYNFGPRTICFKHKDFANLPFGFCTVTALGQFDPTQGGHLILWDLQLVIEFPPGSTILLPSAIIAHSNTSIHKHETRYSFSQYTAGAIFRWVENQCTAQETYHAKLTLEERSVEQKKNEARWKFGLSLLPTVPEDVAVAPL